MSKTFAIAVPATLFSLTAFGQDLLQCVDPDVANALLFNGRPELRMSVTDALPESIADFRAPAGFDLIGSAVRGAGDSETVAFKTLLSSEDAFAAMLASLEADGWAAESDQRIPQTFNIAQPVNATVCRDGERRSLMVQEADGARFAVMNTYAAQPARACNEEDPRLALGGRGMFELMRTRMPKLDFPATARAAAGGLGGGMSGSGETTSTSTRIQSPDTAASLAEHLAEQLSAQGWRRDASWNGSRSAGSTWTRLDDGAPYWGTLDIVNVGGDDFEVGFMLMARPF